MLKEEDKIFNNLFGYNDWDLKGAQERGVWKNTKDILNKGSDYIIDEIKKRLRDTYGEVINIDGIRVENSKGWFLIRASNTQNQLTCRAEALNKEDLYNLTNLIENQLKLSGVDFTFSHV